MLLVSTEPDSFSTFLLLAETFQGKNVPMQSVFHFSAHKSHIFCCFDEEKYPKAGSTNLLTAACILYLFCLLLRTYSVYYICGFLLPIIIVL